MKIFYLSFALLLLASITVAQEKNTRRTERDAKKEARREKIDNLIRQQEEGALAIEYRRLGIGV